MKLPIVTFARLASADLPPGGSAMAGRGPDVTREYRVAGVSLLMDADAPRERWLEGYRAAVEGEPDLRVRVVDRVPGTTPVRHIILHRDGATDAGYVVFDRAGRGTLIPLGTLGRPSTVWVERGLEAIAHLTEMIHWTALEKSWLPLHASAFRFGGSTVLASGWPGGGKTSLLLAYAAHGAEAIGDDWTYLAADGRPRGLALPVTVRTWQLDQLASLRRKIGPGLRARSRLRRTLAAAVGLAGALPLPSSLRRIGGKLASDLSSRADVTVPAARIFSGEGARPEPVAVIFLPICHEAPQIAVERVSSEVGLGQLLEMQLAEWEPLRSAHAACRALFPDVENPLLEELPSRLGNRLRERLGDVPMYRVAHPHPVDLEALFEATRPFLDAAGLRGRIASRGGRAES